MINSLPKNKKIILFDGVCNLCNNTINKIIKYDKKNCFVFASLQSDIGKTICAHLHIDTSKVDSIILYHPNISYDVKSTAVLKILNHFKGLWKIIQLFWIFPEPIRNMMYNLIAKNRYKWFGKKNTCMIPTPEIQAKFLN